MIKNQRGFTLLELIVVAGIIGMLAAVALGVTSNVVRSARGEAGAQQLDAFLRRHRELAVARRRDIEIRFLGTNQVQSAMRAIPNPPAATPAPEELETITYEGNVQYRLFPGLPDTPNAFGNVTAVSVGPNEPVMFSSEGSFLDVDSNPVNATIMLGVENEPLTASAVTILGASATIERWRWNGSGWTK